MAKERYEDHTGLIHTITRKALARASGMGSTMDYHDLYQETCVAFVKAADGFKPELGWKFSTYFMTTAWRHLNKMFEKEENYRVHLGVISIEKLSSPDLIGEGDPLDYVAAAGDFSYSPEEILEQRQEMESAMAEFSPLATRIVEWLIEPPEELALELNRIAAHKSLVRGKEVEVCPPSIGDVCSFLVLGGIEQRKCDAARREVMAVAKRL